MKSSFRWSSLFMYLIRKWPVVILNISCWFLLVICVIGYKFMIPSPLPPNINVKYLLYHKLFEEIPSIKLHSICARSAIAKLVKTWQSQYMKSLFAVGYISYTTRSVINPHRLTTDHIFCCVMFRWRNVSIMLFVVVKSSTRFVATVHYDRWLQTMCIIHSLM